jgi:hypothetical protein
VSGRIPIGQGATAAVLGGLLVFVLALGALTGCGGPQNEGGGNTPNTTTQPPVEETTRASEAPSRNVVVRVSGAQDTAYSGTYGTPQNVRVAEGVLGTEPTDYDVEGVVQLVTATFKKTQPGRGTLKASILNNGEVVTESETSAEFGSITVNWSPQEETQGGTTLPGGFGSDRSQ